MNAHSEKHAARKEKVVHELKEMLVIFLYLSAVFCAFTAYRQLVMEEEGISYFHYGFALIKALVLAKVILLGKLLRFTTMFDDRPLIVPTLYKVMLFSLFTLAFDVLEHVIGGTLHDKSVRNSLLEILGPGRDELFSRLLVMLFAFIPFFAFGELSRTLGEGRIGNLFFHKRPLVGSAK